MIKKIFSGLLFVFISIYFLMGGVNLKNGNFYISYKDIEFGDQYVFKDITRTYNSKGTGVGLFGYGWGSAIETYIKFYPDGTIIMKEHGGGRTVDFSTSFYDESLRDEMIDELVDVALAEDDIQNNPGAIISFREKLTNAELRNAYWDKYKSKNLVGYVDTYAEGAVWEAFESGNLKITKTEKSYQLTNGDFSRNEFFNEDGHLIRKEDRDGRYVTLHYSKKGSLQKLLNDDGTAAIFTLNGEGRVVEISLSNGDKATFWYQGEDLVKSKDTGNYIYQFSYDQAHNLTGIAYEDGSKMSIEYYSNTYYTKKVTEKGGDVTEYQYTTFYNDDGTENKDHYGTKVIKKDYLSTVLKEEYSKPPREHYYEWWIQTDPQGKRYTYRIIGNEGGVQTTTYYDEICNKPLKIILGQDSTTFAYNNRCLLVEKVPSNGTPIRLKYHDILEKIVWVENEYGVTNFEYDEKGNLTHADNDDGEIVDLMYNENGKILIMRSNTETLHFTYNALGKPEVIKLESGGTVQIKYDENGEVLKVSSEDGYKMALKITQAFQQLLAITKPSGVNLGI